MGNPAMQLGSYSALKLPLKRVKVVAAGWYGVNKQPVKVGQVLELSADDAAGVVARGLAKYAD